MLTDKDAQRLLGPAELKKGFDRYAAIERVAPEVCELLYGEIASVSVSKDLSPSPYNEHINAAFLERYGEFKGLLSEQFARMLIDQYEENRLANATLRVKALDAFSDAVTMTLPFVVSDTLLEPPCSIGMKYKSDEDNALIRPMSNV